ncbi:protein PHYTOCHROME KINASE SUBSTRATE 1 [Gossypium raimondii]|uniref:Protein PHYTOCHROME KINASE SUBSTRATE 1-like n=2 Tax=Gossypium raimondii TaxID=29730 RepID=A0A0D2QLS2_GOSRA|nr:protein PHYTOCHROME KINASE SUBSTRATE 1 [Gossypium raimondii]KJB08230.1 hypothetical protein B456_001G071900 [Gossypium raimondii]
MEHLYSFLRISKASIMESDKRKNPHPAIAPSAGIRTTPARLDRNKMLEEGETSVFGAEKYFSMKLDDDDDEEYSNKPVPNRGDPHRMMTPRRLPGTPSASSEASWNSQSVLLRSSMRNRSENRLKKVDGRSFFSNLSCTGSCSDGKSVYVNQNVDYHGRVVENRKDQIQINHRPNNLDRRKRYQAKLHNQSFDRMSVRSNREAYYYKPQVLNPGLQNVTVKAQLDDDPRKSLEVFGSTAIKKGDIAKNLERKLSMLSWDAIPNAPTISSISRSRRLGDDIESDTSSDLFEIDNISGSGQALFTRQVSDGMSSCMTPYAPSETSIEWSVVTASAAADCSFISDRDGKKSSENIRVQAGRVTKEAQRSRSGGILGCKSLKAVMVAENAYRSDEKAKPTKLHQFPKPVTAMPSMKDLDFS